MCSKANRKLSPLSIRAVTGQCSSPELSFALKTFTKNFHMNFFCEGHTCMSGSLMWLRNKTSGPSCSKLTMSLVNDSLKFTSSDTQIC